MQQKVKSICIFGIYDPQYSRNKVVIRGFKENDVNVYEIRVNPKEVRGIKKYFILWKQARVFLRDCKKNNVKIDFVFCAFPAQTVVPLANVIFGKRRVIFDAFTSLFDSNVKDRKLYGAISFRGIKDYFLDWQACMKARFILTDTRANIDYFVKTFKVKRSKFIRVFVGSGGQILNAPNKRSDHGSYNDFLVHFHGTFTPLQGISYIVEAASIIEKIDRTIRFRILGNGQEYEKILALKDKLGVSNIIFEPRVSFDELLRKVDDSDIALGVFGASDKTDRVIPNKVFEAIIRGKVIVTARTRGVQELFTDRENVLFCEKCDPQSLADAILEAKNNVELYHKIEEGAIRLAHEAVAPKKIIADLILSIISKL